jgi:hypothetical protein
MNAQRAIDTAYSANAVEFANVEATKVFRNELENTTKIPFILTPAQEKKVREGCEFPVMFTREKAMTSDHAVLASYREAIRQVLKNQSDVKKIAVKSLIVGAASREYFSYGENKNVDFHFALSEAKDQVRVVESILQDTMKRLKKNATPSDKRLFYSDEDISSKQANSRVVKFRNTKTLLTKLAELDGNDVRIIFGDLTKTKRGPYTHLYFEDVGYNFSEKDWCDIFENTEAISGDGYMFLPLELKFPHMPSNELYTYTNEGGRSHVTYKYGFGNGYSHETDRWSTILNKAVLTNGNIALSVELTSRAGPMYCFKMSRVACNDTVIRSISLPEDMRYVRVLDLYVYFLNDGKVKHYKSIRRKEFEETVVYAMSLAEKSLTMENLTTYVRRMRAGVSMANAEFLKPWTIDNDEIHNFVAVVMVYCLHLRSKSDAIITKGDDAIKEIRNWLHVAKKIGRGFLCAATLGLCIPIKLIYHWMIKYKVIDNLVIDGDDEDFQTFSTFTSVPAINVEFKSHDSTAGGVDLVCDICQVLDGRLGKQVLRCKHVEDSTHCFDISSADLKSLKSKIDETIETGPTGLSTFMKKIKNFIPSVGFKHTVRIENFHGGPGTGKSYIAKTLVDESTLIVGPFSKLAEDYVEYDDAGKVSKTYPYVTMHKALEEKNKATVFFDEWTCIDYNLMGVILKCVGAKNAFLFGDINQTGVLPSEGRPPSMVFDMSRISTHDLLVNFRNGQYTVALLNSMFGYHMYANSELTSIPQFFDIDGGDDLELGNATPMTYSAATADMIVSEGESSSRRPTVRRFQGTTVEKTALFFTDSDYSLINNKQLFCVAMSRDRAGVNFYTDSGEAKALMRACCRVDDQDFLDNIGQLSRPDISSYVSKTRKTNVVDLKSLLYNDRSVGEYAKFASVNPFILPTKVFGVNNVNTIVTEEDQVSPTTVEPEVVVNDVVPTRGSTSRLNQLLRGSLGFSNANNSRVSLPSGAQPVISPVSITAHDLTVETSISYDVPYPGTSPLSVEDEDCFKGWCTLAALSSQVPPAKLKDYKSFVFSNQSSRDGVAFHVVKSFLDLKKIPFVAICRDEFIHCDKDPKVGLLYNDNMTHVEPLEFSTYKKKYKISCGTCGLVEEPTLTGSDNYADIIVDGHTTVANKRYCDGGVNVGIICDANAGSLFVEDQTKFVLNSQEAEDKVQYFSGNNGFDKKLVVRGEISPDLIVRPTKAGFDSFLQGDLLIPNMGTHFVTKSTNEPWANNGMYELARNGVISADFVAPINQRGHPKPQKTQGYVASQGYGNRYFTSNNWQSLQSFQHRYVRQRKLFRFCDGAKKLAREVADMAIFELFDLEKLKTEFVDMDMSHISNEFRRAAMARSYVEKFEGEKGSDPRTVRYHLKDIFKPVKDGNFDPTKPGQGISAWSASANLDFGSAMRIISSKFKNSLKNNVLFNNGYTEEEFSALLNNQLSTLPVSAKTGVVDGKEFDSMQNEFTQEIEKNILKAVGVSDEFIYQYYSYRKDYVLLSTNLFVGYPSAEKTSGEPGTLLLNSILEMVLSNAILRGVGPFVMAVQGDDGLKVQSRMLVDETMLTRVSLYSDFKLKVEIGKDVEFCGDVVAGNVMYPCIYRTVQKIFGNVFKNISHFQEYQVSLRDKINYIERLGVSSVIAANCKTYNVGFETVNCMYDMIKSFSHINEEQFLEVFKQVEFDHSGPNL